MNLLQTAIEAMLFYHPAVWWVSNTLRQQREHCCDDIVLSTGADPGLYTTTLHSLEQARPRLAMAATGGALEARIRRILGVPGKPGLSTAPLLVAFSLAAAFLAAQTAPRQDYPKWLREEVQYIIQNDERQTFRSLQSDDERTRFIEQFWLRRGPAAQQEHYRRLAYTAAHFGPKTDRARTYITYGPPGEIDSHPQGDATISDPWEEWLYRYIAGVGDHVKIMFRDVGRAGQFPMTMSPPAKLTPWHGWLNEDVVYIVRLEERQAFTSLTTDDERAHFIEQFWQVRGDAAKEEHYRRITYANQHFPESDLPGWRSDRGRTYIVYGPPDEIDAHPSDQVPSVSWRYRSRSQTLTFQDSGRTGQYHLVD
jgi:GWxTD domain-containing protein